MWEVQEFLFVILHLHCPEEVSRLKSILEQAVFWADDTTRNGGEDEKAQEFGGSK